MQIHQLQGYIQNIFIIEYEHACLMLDGASKADFETIAVFFKVQLQRPLTDLKVVVVTHMHPDHAGCAHYLRDKIGCIIVCGKFEHQWYAGISGRLAHLTDILLAHWVAGKLGRKRRLIWYPSRLEPDLMLNDGEQIPLFDDWQILATPGHTSMDISLVNHTQKLCYLADLIVKVKGRLTSPFPVNFPAQYKQSLQRLHAISDFTMLMAHVPSQQIHDSELLALIEQAPQKPQNARQVVFNLTRKLAGFKNTPVN